MGLKLLNQEGLVIVRFEVRRLTSDEQILRISNDLNEVLASTATGTRLLLDFENIELVASMMLGDLVALNKKALQKGVVLQFCGLSADVLRVIQTCKLHSLFDILEDPPRG